MYIHIGRLYTSHGPSPAARRRGLMGNGTPLAPPPANWNEKCKRQHYLKPASEIRNGGEITKQIKHCPSKTRHNRNGSGIILKSINFADFCLRPELCLGEQRGRKRENKNDKVGVVFVSLKMENKPANTPIQRRRAENKE